MYEHFLFIILVLAKNVNLYIYHWLRKFTFGFNGIESSHDALIKYQAVTCGSTLLHIFFFFKF